MKMAKACLVERIVDSILQQCKSGLDYQKEFSVEGLLGVTLDKNDVFLIPVKELVSAKDICTSDKAQEETSETPVYTIVDNSLIQPNISECSIQSDEFNIKCEDALQSSYLVQKRISSELHKDCGDVTIEDDITYSLRNQNITSHDLMESEEYTISGTNDSTNDFLNQDHEGPYQYTTLYPVNFTVSDENNSSKSENIVCVTARDSFGNGHEITNSVCRHETETPDNETPDNECIHMAAHQHEEIVITENDYRNVSVQQNAENVAPHNGYTIVGPQINHCAKFAQDAVEESEMSADHTKSGRRFSAHRNETAGRFSADQNKTGSRFSAVGTKTGSRFSALRSKAAGRFSDIQNHLHDRQEDTALVGSICVVKDTSVGDTQTTVSFGCSLCVLYFDERATLNKHIWTHSDGEGYLKCPSCDKKFRSHYKVKEHMITHTNDMPFSCPKCGKKFRQSSSLGRHVNYDRCIRRVRKKTKPQPKYRKTISPICAKV